MKAMRKVSRGSSFRGALDYVFDREPVKSPGKLLGGNMTGRDPRSLASEFKLSREQRADIAKPVWHQSLRLPAGERLPEALWLAITDDYMLGMGFTNQHQHIVVLHDDPGGQHVHIIASRVGLDGGVWKGRDENLITTKLVSSLEMKHGLALTAPATNGMRTERRKPKRGEIEKALRTGFKPPRMTIQDAIDRAIRDGAHTLDDLESSLQSKCVWMHRHVGDDGTVRGLSFECDGSRFSGSQLGDLFKFRSIQERMKHEQQNATAQRTTDTCRNSRVGAVQERSDTDHQKVDGACVDSRKADSTNATTAAAGTHSNVQENSEIKLPSLWKY